MNTNDALIILAKYPRPRQVKTRLIPQFGERTASRITEVFLADLLHRFVTTPFRIVVVGALMDTEKEFRSLLAHHAIPQDRVEIFLPRTGSMMGDIEAAYAVVLKESRKAVLTAADIPYLTAGMVEALLRELDGHDVVFHPNFDGTACPHGFKAPADLWNGCSATYLGAWFDRIRSLRLSYKCLEPIFDIDCAKDLEVFYDWQVVLEDSRCLDVFCPLTMSFLRSLRKEENKIS